MRIEIAAQVVTTATLMSLCSCASSAPLLGKTSATLETAPLIITEVAQATDFDGTTADKVEVYCTAAGGCASFKVCDTGSSCSATQPAIAEHARMVVSRGSLLTSTDQVWLATASGMELPETRVGPFACSTGQAQSRLDCTVAAFDGCGSNNLGASAGTCSAGDSPEPFVASVRFTTNQHGQPEPTCTRPVCLELLAAIDAAETSIDFAVYGVRAQEVIVDALAAAQARGVIVRGVVDSEDASCTSFGYSDTPALMAALEPGSVVCDTGSGYSYIMHNKFFVFDGAKLWTGSTNISDTELGGEYSSDVATLLSSYRLAAIYAGEFEEMFLGSFHNRKTDNTPHAVEASHFTDGTVVRSYFSPTDAAIAGAVIPLIEEATTTLDIAMFYFTSQAIADAILAAHQRGVVVRMVLDASGAGNAYSKHGILCSSGVAVRVENWGGKSHSKWAVADAGTANAAVVFGSMNWTSAGDGQNDENTLYVKNPSFAAAFAAEFERQWADLAGVPVCAMVSVEGADSSMCSSSGRWVTCSSGSCCDGIDNDYDGRTDLQEEACACSDNTDNDGDGYTDSSDFDCQFVVDP